MTTPIITPEVRAALERLRDPDKPYPSVNGYTAAQNYAFARNAMYADRLVVANAMLALCPPGMPEPVEMFVSDAATNTRTRGLFCPLNRIGS